MTIEANTAGSGDSRDHGDENSPVKNTAPDKRTTRRTSDSTSMSGPSSGTRCNSRRNGQASQSLEQHVKRIRRLEQDAQGPGHSCAASVDARWGVAFDTTFCEECPCH